MRHDDVCKFLLPVGRMADILTLLAKDPEI